MALLPGWQTEHAALPRVVVLAAGAAARRAAERVAERRAVLEHAVERQVGLLVERRALERAVERRVGLLAARRVVLEHAVERRVAVARRVVARRAARVAVADVGRRPWAYRTK
jgi:hypothetical protein